MGESKQLSSSHLDVAQYDEESQDLRITFKNGSTYVYSGVPEHIAQGLFTAASPGRYLNTYLIGFFRVTPE